jgi:predicted N-acyltransferase
MMTAMESHGCVGAPSGWLPRHLVVWHGDHLLGACPSYVKTNSYGELVFDWAWADAYRRAGLPYYPKLVAAVPYTPVSGPRLLVAPGADSVAVKDCLIDAALELVAHGRMSTAHWLFPDQAGGQGSADPRRLSVPLAQSRL